MKTVLLFILIISFSACSNGGSGSSSTAAVSSAAISKEKLATIKQDALLSGHSLTQSEIDYLKNEDLVSEKEYQELLALSQN